jgi:hypothetical protein
MDSLIFWYVVEVMAYCTLFLGGICAVIVWKDARDRKKNRLPFKDGIK